MHITWHGLSCVKIQTSQAILLLNPYQDSVGVTMPKLKVDVVAITDRNNEQMNNSARLQGDPLVITTPGEYEIKGLFISGVAYNGSQTIYRIETEGIALVHPGLISSELTDTHLELLEGCDVFFLPLSCEGAKTCSRLVSQIEPRLIIPIQYKTPKLKVKLDPIDAFAKEMGLKNTAGEPKIIVKAKDLPAEETQVKILSAV